MAAPAQAESLLAGVKSLLPEAFKGSMDGETILSYIWLCQLCFGLVSMSNRYTQALFEARLLQGPVYTWFII